VRVAGRSDSAVVLEFPTVRGRHYYLQCSADLRRWNTLPGVVCGTGGTVQCTNKATVTREFFRVLAVP
jgi:hypothetical protein